MLSDMTDQVRQLLLLRHAKAEHTIGVSDHERRLIERGKRDAAAVGEWLMHFAATIDLVICSTSSRTRQTWEAIEHAGVTATEVEFARGVYSAGAAGVMNLVREADPSVQRILVVGHEPTMSWLAERLTGGDGEVGALDHLAEGFPTSGLAVLDCSTDWKHLDDGKASLTHFVVGRGRTHADH
jgi:phosphohistidine phosphatase